MSPRSFAIHVSDAALDDLRVRLEHTRFPEVIPGSSWDYGVDVPYLRELRDYWLGGYDWRRHEADLNRHPGFLHEVDGLDLHFWHVRGRGPRPFPLILVHGWPGSIYEFHHLIGPLADPAAHGGDPADAFDVVVPALPGYGFGGKPQERGWGPSRTAAAFDRLMADLGYDRYGTQGGDWGGIITARMASLRPDRVAGAHLNFVVAQPPAGDESEETRRAVADRNAFQALETGYSSVHGTKPTSLAMAQADSPMGIAAWIVEKFRTWSDCGGNLESVYTKDQLLTNTMFYWAPNSIASAANMYFEARRDREAFVYGRVDVPTAVSVFPAEPWRAPRAWVEPRFNVQRWTEMPRGGHFAALEQPSLLLDDVRAFFRRLR